MRFVRSILGGIFFVGFALGSLVIGGLLFPPLALVRAHRAKRALVRFAYRLFTFMGALTGLFRIEISPEDRAKLSAARGKVVVANHLTLIDVVVLMSLMGDTTAVAKSGAGRNFFYSLIVKGAFLVNDDPVQVLDAAAAALAQGTNLIVFPEGTRTLPSESGRKLRRGAAQIALRASAPVLPVRLECVPLVLAKGQPWHALADRTIVWRLSVQDEIPPASSPSSSLHSAAVALTGKIRKSICGTLGMAALWTVAVAQAAQPALDELMLDWVAQDSGLAPRVAFEAGGVTNRYAAALKKFNLSKGENETWDAALERYRACCLKRRAERLAKTAAMAKKWVYARHYVTGATAYEFYDAASDTPTSERCFKPGGGVYVAEYDEKGFWKETPLMESKTGAFRDVDVSFDGQRILYAFKGDLVKDDFHLYEYNLATGKSRQLTFGEGIVDFEGAYLPDGHIVFSSTRCCQVVDCWWTDATNLFRMDADGHDIFRLTFDQVNDMYPVVNDAGDVLYTRWEYSDRAPTYVTPVFRMNPDGTRQRAICGSNSYYPPTIGHVRMVGSGPVFFAIGTGHHQWHPGELLKFDPRQGPEGTEGVWAMEPYRKFPSPLNHHDGRLEPMVGQYGRLAMYPYPVDDNSVVLSFLPEGSSWFRQKKSRIYWHNGTYAFRGMDDKFGLYWTDVNGARELLVSRELASAPCGRPVPLRVRVKPQRPVKVPDENAATGTIYISDVYEGPSMAGVARGKVKKIRVIGIDYRPGNVGIGRGANTGPGGPGDSCLPPALGFGTWDPKRIFGEVPVEADGSVAFIAPARTPFYFQLLDEKGRAIQSMRSWTVLQPGEQASCIGCHEDRRQAPPMKDAAKRMHKPVHEVKRPARAFSFKADVEPILERRCVKCHAPEVNPKIPDLTCTQVKDVRAKRVWTKAYVNLTHAHLIGRPAKHYDYGTPTWVGQHDHPLLNWISSGSVPTLLPPYTAGAATSKLFSERLDKGHCKDLTAEELHTLAAWVDLCVPYCADYKDAADWTEEDWLQWRKGLSKTRRLHATFK